VTTLEGLDEMWGQNYKINSFKIASFNAVKVI
jgi:hypothetical protein